MLKNITLYRISSAPDFNTVAIDISPFAFEPCGPTQEKSVGWIPPRGHANGPHKRENSPSKTSVKPLKLVSLFSGGGGA